MRILIDQAIQAQFDVLLTGDSNIKHQQNLSARAIAIVILRAENNRLSTHIPLMSQVAQMLLTIKPGQLVEITSTR